MTEKNNIEGASDGTAAEIRTVKKKVLRAKNKPEATKFFTECQKEHENSLQCIYRNYDNQERCEPLFQVYRECKREEHKRKLEENARNPKPLF